MRMINRAGLDLIKKSENDNDPKAGYRVTPSGEVYFVPYIDPVGVCTIGFGTIMYEDGTHVTMRDPIISLERAYALLQYEAREKAEHVDSFLRRHNITANDNQFAALVSLAYNIGVGVITNMDSSVRSALIKRNPEALKKAFRLYVKGTKKIFGIPRKVTLPGLVERRERELALYFKVV